MSTWLTSCSHEPGGGLHASSCFTRFTDAGVPDSELATPDARPFRFFPPFGSGLPPIASKYSSNTSAAVSLVLSVMRPNMRPTRQRTCCPQAPMSGLSGRRNLAISRRTIVCPGAVSRRFHYKSSFPTLTILCARIFSTTNQAHCQCKHSSMRRDDAYSSGSPSSLSSSSSSSSSTSSTALVGFLVGLPFICAGTASSPEESLSLRAAAQRQ